jgi:hypothetical protein
MPNQSLARIMYGTSEEYHASGDTNASILSTQSRAESTDKSAAEPETLGELLHRVWTNLSGKH